MEVSPSGYSKGTTQVCSAPIIASEMKPQIEESVTLMHLPTVFKKQGKADVTCAVSEGTSCLSTT